MIDLLLIGLGNIGLALSEYIARMAGIASVVLCDHDGFSAENVAGQLVSPCAIGQPKVDIVAARMADVNPQLRIEARRCRLEDLPRGYFRTRVVASCLDTRLARAHLSEICFSMSTALWLDAGVRADGLLARASAVFPSHPASTCICCGWSVRDWDALAAEFSCTGTAVGSPTRSPTFLGGAAASLLAHLLDRFRSGKLPACAEVHSRMLSLEAHRAWTTTVRRNPACRCRHEHWTVEPLGRSSIEGRLGDFLNMGPLALPGLPFVSRMRCVCGRERAVFHVASRMSEAQTRCSSCGRTMNFGALDLKDEIDLFALEDVGPGAAAVALADIGITEGDIVRLGGRRYLEVGATATLGGW